MMIFLMASQKAIDIRLINIKPICNKWLKKYYQNTSRQITYRKYQKYWKMALLLLMKKFKF